MVIRFEGVETRIPDGELDKLRMIGEQLRQYGERRIRIEGHADTSRGNRLQVSRQRAQAAADYLIANGYIPAGRVDVQGYGAEQPRAPNDTPENRAMNRRVEILILKD
jgi:OOP family OmpA-OmpF porin